MGLTTFLSSWIGGTAAVTGSVLLSPTIIGGAIGFFAGISGGKDRTGNISTEIVARFGEGLIYIIPGIFVGAVVNVIFSIPLFIVALVCGSAFLIGFPIASLIDWIFT